MGNRITQRIYECYICGKTPENGEYMWRMDNEIWCEQCCNQQENVSKEDELKVDTIELYNKGKL